MVTEIGTNLRISTYLPSFRLTNEEIEKWGIPLIDQQGGTRLLTANDILKKTGISQRPIASAEETVVSMAIRAAAPLLESNPRVDFVLFSTSYPIGKNNAEEVVNQLGLKSVRGCVDIHAACSGFTYALGLLASDEDYFAGKRVLLLTAEKYSPTVIDLRKGRDPALSQTIFGDGAAATSFIYGKELQVLAYKELEDFSPEACQALKMPVDGNLAAQPAILRKIPYHPKFWMDGKQVFEAVMQSLPEAIREVVKSSGLATDEIDLLVPHQASKHMLEGLVRRLRSHFDPGRILLDLSNGNLSSASIPVALAGARGLSRLGREKNRLILAGFGAGLFGSVVAAELN